MATGFGYNGWVGFATESTFGTYVASQKFIEITKESIVPERKQQMRPALRQISINNSFAGKRIVKGNISAQFNINGMEKLLYHALGTDSTTGSSPYTHAYTCADTLPTGLSFHVNRDAANVGTGSAFKYMGCNISKLSLMQKMEEPLEISVDIIGQDWGVLNVETPTFPTLATMNYSQLGTFTVGGNAFVISDFEVSVENALASDRYYLGADKIRGLGRSGPRKVSGSFTKEFESLTEYNVFRNLTSSAIVATWTSGANSLSISMPNCYLQTGEPSISDAGPIKQKFEFEAIRSSTAGDEFALTLINTTASGT
jgi:hypothetical protein